MRWSILAVALAVSAPAWALWAPNPADDTGQPWRLLVALPGEPEAMRERFATRDLCLQDLVRRVPRVPSGTRLVCREDGDGGEGTGGRRDDERVYIGPKRR